MGIYIDGMEMPKEGSWTTVRIYPDGTCARPNWQGDCTLIKDTKAVPVSPHGRCIDAGEFLKRAIGTKCFRGDYALMLEELVGESPTIIPADPAEDGDT